MIAALVGVWAVLSVLVWVFVWAATAHPRTQQGRRYD